MPGATSAMRAGRGWRMVLLGVPLHTGQQGKTREQPWGTVGGYRERAGRTGGELEAGGAARQEGHEGLEKAFIFLHPEGLVRALGWLVVGNPGQHRGRLGQSYFMRILRAMARSSSSRSCSRDSSEGGAGLRPVWAPRPCRSPYLALVLLLDHLLLRCLLICLDCGERGKVAEGCPPAPHQEVEAELREAGLPRPWTWRPQGRHTPAPSQGPPVQERAGPSHGQMGGRRSRGALEGRGQDVHCLLSAFCILSLSFSCGVSLGWGRGRRGRRPGGCPGAPTTHLIQEPGTGRGRLQRLATRVWEPQYSGRGKWGTGLNPWGWISQPTRAPLQAHRAQLSGTAAGGN